MNTKTGTQLIAEERHRQQSVEGYTEEHDDTHKKGEMTAAAVCYAMDSVGLVNNLLNPPPGTLNTRYWPWEKKWWKPSEDPRRNLAKAGALIAAEIDRLNRLEGK